MEDIRHGRATRSTQTKLELLHSRPGSSAALMNNPLAYFAFGRPTLKSINRPFKRAKETRK